MQADGTTVEKLVEPTPAKGKDVKGVPKLIEQGVLWFRFRASLVVAAAHFLTRLTRCALLHKIRLDTAAPDEQETYMVSLATPVEEKDFHHISRHLGGIACWLFPRAKEIVHELFSVSHGASPSHAVAGWCSVGVILCKERGRDRDRQRERESYRGS